MEKQQNRLSVDAVKGIIRFLNGGGYSDNFLPIGRLMGIARAIMNSNSGHYNALMSQEDALVIVEEFVRDNEEEYPDLVDAWHKMLDDLE